MKDPLTILPALYARLAKSSWARLTGEPPAPARELTPKAAQAAANQEWEHEGGNVTPLKKPGMKAVPEIPV